MTMMTRRKKRMTKSEIEQAGRVSVVAVQGGILRILRRNESNNPRQLNLRHVLPPTSTATREY
jgi:hypothetical protein